MKKRFMTKKVDLTKATTDELFTELIRRVRLIDNSNVFFIDSTSMPKYPQWSLYAVGNKGIAKEIKHD